MAGILPTGPTVKQLPGRRGGRLAETVAFHRDPLGYLRAVSAARSGQPLERVLDEAPSGPWAAAATEESLRLNPPPVAMLRRLRRSGLIRLGATSP